MTQTVLSKKPTTGNVSPLTKANTALYTVALWLLTVTTMQVQQKQDRLKHLRAGPKPEDKQNDRGAVTAEYAIVIMAAVAFAGLLVVIMRSGQVQEMLTQLVQNALNSAG